jgi:spermidine synthase
VWWFLFFLGSGFAGLVYEVVWLRLAMAAFGVTTPLVSLVLSTFMAGLALGSWLGGRLAGRFGTLRAYAVTEAAIALLALAVPASLRGGRALLIAPATTLTWDSGTYYIASAAWVAATLLPACTLMGATFPLAIAAIRRARPDASERAFSFLYLANVFGATCGTLVAAFVLIELVGFRATLAVGAGVQALVAVGALALSRSSESVGVAVVPTAEVGAAPAAMSRGVLVCLFATGFTSMAMELVWIRQFSPYLGNLVYAFAGILATYLAATFIGSRLYLTWIGPEATTRGALTVWYVAAVAGVLPLIATDPRLALAPPFRLLLGVPALCVAVGMLTPMLVDRWATGHPGRAGAGYAMNVLGSIVGPLVAGFVLLPSVGERASIVLLIVPLLVIAVVGGFRPAFIAMDASPGAGPAVRRVALAPVVAALVVVAIVSTRDFSARYDAREVRRDHTATVIATGSGMSRDLLVNGTSTTVLTPVTKWMAHVPLAFLGRQPSDALVICFGMGTTFRSLLSWDIRATAVELVPSVPELFSYYHADAPDLLRSGRARIVIDDGRRYLERSPETYDVITIDPPNPPEAAGSSLLYSRELYAVARARLRPGGILQQWIPITDVGTIASVTRAIAESFPHVRAFPSVNRRPTLQVLGVHYLASDRPIPQLPIPVLAARFPPKAVRDLLEWPGEASLEGHLRRLLEHEVPLEALTGLRRSVPALTDNRPYNEYFLLRRWVLP